MKDELRLLARAVGVVKTLGEVVAVRSASVSFRAGEIHALCGENGAGKSSLLKVVAGMMVPDSGYVEAFGSRLEPHTPREGIRRGIGMVLQHFALVPVFSALENIVLGAEPTSSLGVIDLQVARRRAQAVAKELGVVLPLDALVESLGVGDRQRLEIARALYRDAKLLILDEPTAALDARAEYEVFQRFAELTVGKMAVLISHRFSTVRMADRILVLTRGELVEQGSHEELVQKAGLYAELFHLQAAGYR